MSKSDWLGAVLGVIFLGAGALMSTLGRRLTRGGGIALMAIGFVGLIFWFGYYRNVEAQTEMGPVIAQNGPSINTWNQSGGNNTIVVGPTRLTFDSAIGEDLISKIPPGKPITLQSIGSSSDQAVADQYQRFLQSRGFNIATRNMIGMMAPLRIPTIADTCSD
jgi:hypothetical protein